MAEIQYLFQFELTEIVFTDTKLKEENIKKINQILNDMKAIHRDIGFIVKRINEESKIFPTDYLKNDQYWTFPFMHTDDYIYLCMDIKTIYWYILLQLDKIPKFLNLLFEGGGNKPQINSMRNYLKTICNKKGDKNFDDLKNIILSYKNYHDEIDKIRDKLTAHDVAANQHLILSNNYWGIVLRGYTNDDIVYKVITRDLLEKDLSQLAYLFIEIHQFLSERINQLPFKRLEKI